MPDDEFPTPTPAPESLPEELLGMERRILADSADWERRVPATDAFNQRLRRRLTEERMRDPNTSSTPSWPGERVDTGELTTPAGPSRRPPSRTRTLLSAAAAVVIVGLLAAVFADLTHGRTRQSPAASTTATRTASAATVPPTPSRAQVSTNQSGTPVVAPSDPNVIYEYADNGTGVVLRRSEDGGSTWQNLTYPAGGSFVSAIELAVSPLDAKNVFLRLDLGYQPGGNSPCQAITEIQHGGIMASDSSICRVELASQDGGAHWSRIKLPIPGTLFQGGVTFTYDATTIQAGADRLYGRVWQLDANGTQTGDVRIVSTQDDGRSWQAADTDLLSQAGHICAFNAAPASATVFAITSSATCWANPAGTRAVWRSDDAGAHWARAGDLPAPLAQPESVFVAAGASGAGGVTPVLYGVPGAGATAGAAEVLASSDGGQTWHAAPTAGLPAGAQIAGVAGNAPSDGSLLIAATGASASPASSATPGATAGASTPTVTPSQSGESGGDGGPQTTSETVICYTWKPGETGWRAVTPAASVSSPYLSNVFASNGPHLVVTLSIANDQSSNPTYTLQRLG